MRALLDQLRASQVWQDSLGSSTSGQPADARAAAPAITEPSSTVLSPDEDALVVSDVSGPSATVAALLSQLSATVDTPREHRSTAAASPTPARSQPSQNASHVLANPTHPPSEPSAAYPAYVSAHKPALDLRSCTFQQALPHLVRLSEDADFVTAVKAVRVA